MSPRLAAIGLDRRHVDEQVGRPPEGRTVALVVAGSDDAGIASASTANRPRQDSDATARPAPTA